MVFRIERIANLIVRLYLKMIEAEYFFLSLGNTILSAMMSHSRWNIYAKFVCKLVVVSLFKKYIYSTSVSLGLISKIVRF